MYIYAIGTICFECPYCRYLVRQGFPEVWSDGYTERSMIMADYHEIQAEIYTPVSSKLLHSKEFQKLPLTARYVFICMIDTANGSRVFKVPSAQEYGLHKDTLKGAVNKLIQAGLVNVATAEDMESVTA